MNVPNFTSIMLHEFLSDLILVFLKPHLLCLNFPGKPARACGCYIKKRYYNLKKTLTLVTSLLYDLADERDLFVLSIQHEIVFSCTFRTLNGTTPDQ